MCQENQTNSIFMHVSVTSNFDDDSIKNEQVSMEKSLSRVKIMEYF